MDSPSKNLVEGLQEFHISSPGRRNNDEYGTGNREKLSVKQYLPNNDFADSKFLSFVEGSQSKSYVRKLGDWSMSYGTVQQRPGDSPQRMNADNRSSFEDGFENFNDNFNDENAETPQWKQYMVMQSQLKSRPMKQRQSDLQQEPQFNLSLEKQSEQNSRDPPSDLVLTASLSDISGIPTNTFKRRDRRKNNEQSRESRETQDYEDEEEDDIDPALEARGVFDNILRKQKSNYELPPPRKPAAYVQPHMQPDSAGSTDSTSSYFGETPSSLSPADIEFKPPTNKLNVRNNYDYLHNNNNKNNNNNNGIDNDNSKDGKYGIQGMKLITPEEMGLVFDNVNGVWYKPAPKNQDISSSRTLDSSTNHSQSEFTSDFSIRKSLSQPHRQYVGNREQYDDVENDYEEEEYDDTPMDVPEIDPKFLLKKRESGKLNYPSHPESAVDVTTVSQVNTSFQQSKKELVALLTDAIPPRGQDWLTQVDYVDLSQRDLGPHIVGLDEMLPSLRSINLSHNYLKSLHGVPSGILELNCAHNDLKNCKLDSLPHLETLDLSRNYLNRLGGMFFPCLHLRNINLSYNRIKTLDKDLGSSNILTLNLSNNEIRGTIDFAKLTKGLSRNSSWFHLEEIDLSNNKIDKIYNIGCLSKLRILKLDGNPLQEIVENTESNQLRTLTALGTSGNLKKISMVSSSLFPFHRLRILKCDAHTGSRQWKQLSRSLEELYLQDGDATKIPHWEIIPGSLRSLALTRIKGLRQLPKNFGYRLPSLQELNLRDNELVSCYSLIEALPTLCLVRLDLRDNPLTRQLREKDLINVIKMACNRLSELKV